jgi:hypothetical protein
MADDQGGRRSTLTLVASAVFVGESLPDPLPQIIGKTLELLTVAERAESTHHGVATTIDAVRL